MLALALRLPSQPLRWPIFAIFLANVGLGDRSANQCVSCNPGGWL